MSAVPVRVPRASRAARTPWSARASWGSASLLQAEIALFLVTAAVAISTARLFVRDDYLATLLLVVFVGHVAAAALRRLGVPMLTATLVLLLIGMVVIAWVHYPQTLRWGVPTGRTADTVANDLRDAFRPFRTMTTPAPMNRGFEVGLTAAMWVLLTFADGATFSADAPVQAQLPHTAAFIFTSVLDRGNDFLGVAVLYATSMALFALCVRAIRQTRRAWAPGDTKWGTTFTVSAGVGMLVVAVIAGAIVAPLVPGTGDKGVVDLRRLGSGSGPRQVNSPLVSLQALLNNQSDEIMFTVDSTHGHYWRQTSLDDFTGTGWGSKAVYREIDDDERLRPDIESSAPSIVERQVFRVAGLRDIWLPAAFEPEMTGSALSMRFDRGSSTLILDDDRMSQANDRYTVFSAVPSIDAARLEASDGSSPGAKYLQLPDDFSPGVTRLATQEAGSGSDYEKALQLQSFFRSSGFVYDRSVDYRSAKDPLADFLRERRGFCQQFATAYAAMARAVGLPARVAVGFTFGEPDNPDNPSRWTVRGRNAHAWPEVYIGGTGWVAFEPTPGRGNPDATTYTGLDASQTDPPANTPNTTTSSVPATPSTSTPSVSTTVPITRNTVPPAPAPAAAVPARSAGTSPVVPVLLVIAGLALLVGPVAGRVWWVRRRRSQRRSAERSPERRVHDMWAETCRHLRRVGIVAMPWETPIEFADRAAGELGLDSLADLGPIESERRYAGDATDAGQGARAVDITDQVRELVWTRLATTSRVRGTIEL